MILPGDQPESIAAAADCLRAGGLLGLPTETVYGLAANADDDAAVAQIFKAKGRPADHPLIVHVADASAVAHYASDVPAFATQLMQTFWPGPLTLILPRRPGVANAAAGGNPTIGLRCPSHPVAQVLLKTLINGSLNGGQIPINFLPETAAEKQLGSDPNYSNYSKQFDSDTHCFDNSVDCRCGPDPQSMSSSSCVYGLAAPSANQFGRVSPTTAAHVQGEFGDDLLILDGGACGVGIESTIIDCTRGAPVLLRPGAITPAQVQAFCGLKVLLKEELSAHVSQGPKASGTLESHYAPQARVRLMDAKALQAGLDLLGTDSLAGGNRTQPFLATYSRAKLKTSNAQILPRRMPDDAAATAQQLFAVLRELDAHGVKLIWIETLPDSPDWDGVRDRLQRAAC